MVSSSVRRIAKKDAETQTDESGSAINQSRSSNSLIGGNSPPMFLPSVSASSCQGNRRLDANLIPRSNEKETKGQWLQVSMSSPFHNFLDEELNSSRDPLVDLGHDEDFYNLIS